LHGGTVLFTWSRKGIGFGTIQFGVQDGKPYIDTETMGKEFALDVIVKALTPIIDAEEEYSRQWWAEREARLEAENTHDNG
jgi:hypothetical protein